MTRSKRGLETLAISIALLTFVGIGASLRLAAAASQYPSNRYQKSDVHRYYVSPATSFLAGQGWVTDYGQNYIPPPLQGIFILVVKFLHPAASYGTIREVQALLAALAIPLAFLVGVGMRNRWVGLAAAGFIALDPHVIETSSSLLTESNYFVLLFAFLGALLFALRRQRAATFLGAGALLGLTALMRSFPMLLAVLLPFYFIARGRDRSSLYLSAAFLLGFLLCVGPWIARNYLKYHEIYPISTNGGTLLATSNFLELDPTRTIYWETTRKMPEWRSTAIETRFAGKVDQDGRRLWNERDRLYTRHALEYITTHPLHFARNYSIKLYNVFRYPLGASGVWSYPDIYRAALMLFGLAGLAWFVVAERRTSQRVMVWIFGYFAAFTALLHITRSGRINLPVKVLLSFFAAYLLVGLATAAQRRLRAGARNEASGVEDRSRQS